MMAAVTPAHGGNLLVRNARLADPRTGARVEGGRLVGGRPADLPVWNGVIEPVEPSRAVAAYDEVLDVEGRWVLPGLHDHHLHLRALAASVRSVPVGPDDVDGAAGMAQALREAPPDDQGWRRAVGYHESVAGDLDRAALDAMVPGALVRVQHRTGALWVLSSPALEALGVSAADDPGIERDAAGHPTGRLFRMDAWLAGCLPRDPGIPDLAGLSARLAALGVTGITDATPGAASSDVADVITASDDGRLVQRVHVMCPAEVDVPDHRLVRRGPEKFMLDDDRLPEIDGFAAALARAHAAGVQAAIHCVTAIQLVFALSALEMAGPSRGDRIEHAAIVPGDMLERLASSTATVVVNPGLLFERGDAYLVDVEERERPDLLRGESLWQAGVPVAAGTDAPFGSGDPWVAVAAAHRRRTRRGAALGPAEAIDESRALALFAGDADDPSRRRSLSAGEPGDLCVLDGDALPYPAGDGGPVVATAVAGRVVHRLI
jgi:predicted amidohydrolase YtcJ